ncbi:MAG: ThiF family adenylyltransferase [Phycisphaeraceae bacterium]
MSERDRFYQERDRRTREYGVQDAAFERPVAVVVGEDTAETERGQLLLLSLVHLIARMHHRLVLVVPRSPLIARRALGPVQTGASATLEEAATAVATAVDPFIQVRHKLSGDVKAAIGIGTLPEGKVPWHVGPHNNRAIVSPDPVQPDRTLGFALGPCLAACLGAWLLFRLALGWPVQPQTISAWNLRQNDQAEAGPEVLEPLDVGRVLMVGAGAVGSCLAYWLRLSGVRGPWLVADRDTVALHNTNRSLAFLPADAGWPAGQSRAKALAVADLFGAQSRVAWYDELKGADRDADLVLCLANQGGVRSRIGQRGEPIVLHATTSRGFESQLHRHIPERDDCIFCRVPSADAEVNLECSTVPLKDAGSSTDAAISFLSASAGLMLLSALYRLAAGELEHEKWNWWRLVYGSTVPLALTGKRKCAADCPGTLPAEARKTIQVDHRWSHLDAATGG